MTTVGGAGIGVNLATALPRPQRQRGPGRPNRAGRTRGDLHVRGACGAHQPRRQRAARARRPPADERVLLALADSVEFVATWYAVQKIGAVTAEVYTFLQPKDYAYYLDYTDAVGCGRRCGTRSTRMREASTAARRRPLLLVVDADGDRAPRGRGVVRARSSRARRRTSTRRRARPDDIAIWKFTTGSTGRPKACVHTARSPLVELSTATREACSTSAPTTSSSRCQSCSSATRATLRRSSRSASAPPGVIFADRTTPELIFELIARHRPTILVNVPTMMQAMLDHPSAADQDLSCLRLCTSAGEALPEPLHHRWNRAFGVEVLDGIGSSEAYHIYISNRPGPRAPGQHRRGRPGYAAEVVDDEGRPAARRARSDGCGSVAGARRSCTGRIEEASARTFAGDLVMSGDLVERDGDGYFLVSRTRRRPAQGRRHLGGAGGDRALPRRRIPTWSSAPWSPRSATA